MGARRGWVSAHGFIASWSGALARSVQDPRKRGASTLGLPVLTGTAGAMATASASTGSTPPHAKAAIPMASVPLGYGSLASGFGHPFGPRLSLLGDVPLVRHVSNVALGVHAKVAARRDVGASPSVFAYTSAGCALTLSVIAARRWAVA